jgi:drug/metabolite transporter (DMT)-like permease
MAACVKVVSNYGIPVFEIVAARAVVSLIISYIDVKRKKIPVWGNNKPLLIGRGLAGSLALICVYYAVATLPLADATILQYLHPVFTSILAIYFLKENIQKSTIYCIVLCIVGLIIMAKPSLFFGKTVELPWISVVVALVGAFGTAIAYVIVKRLSQSEDYSVIIFYFPLITLPVSVLFLGNDFLMPDMETFVLLILVGVFTQIGLIGITKAMQTEAASKATAYTYMQVIFSIILGWAFFNEIPSFSTLIGGGFIVVGAMINVLWKQ